MTSKLDPLRGRIKDLDGVDSDLAKYFLDSLLLPPVLSSLETTKHDRIAADKCFHVLFHNCINQRSNFHPILASLQREQYLCHTMKDYNKPPHTRTHQLLLHHSAQKHLQDIWKGQTIAIHLVEQNAAIAFHREQDTVSITSWKVSQSAPDLASYGAGSRQTGRECGCGLVPTCQQKVERHGANRQRTRL